ncbi:MAG: 50S ribosomal protein L29 [Limnoraphis robusta]|jgi:large subunit ribosomal protein L29|uniref:Large ribosomal subunit protein uL29 n=1 Tax=Limnoraphis robusta CCNP1315 TaxID=3110306 RepID=A0ABU5TWW3_9CYAN|nr:50S ribosomal protein L29 [Limnoraphis robusta]MEA5497501.1 50S ribosomal protein L29 [Limnoraphis robusta BA-68 BA1]MEA5519222.1 50S ribosomal protein L29 [Limnoraphis robusta CCNP1315]MEA5539828.1 50S ribosomal protein L29 [Limnoraphis robusta Tam1]MEA5543605.1 50S ribosomal protein L29 [Limnoraphis robusta CCNP1324]
MSFPKVKEARQLNDEQLSNRIIELKKNLANLRLLKATGRLEKPHEFKHAQHELAQLLTVERERQQQAEAEKTASASTTDEPVSA